MLALGAYFGAPETKKNILVILVYLCSRPAQGGGAGLVRYYHQNKTAPEPLAAPELLVLQNKTAPEPPLPYFGGSTSKIKLRQNRHFSDRVNCHRHITGAAAITCIVSWWQKRTNERQV